MKRFLIYSGSFILTVLILGATACSNRKDNENLNINYEKYTMPNGLQVILHTDHSDPVISYAIMYHVGSSRETPGKTGFAHLFEHLLFSGSENVQTGRFDRIIESMGGSNNGFTSQDVTTYYEIFPKNALEKVLWLESDRMGFFINSVTPRLLAIQQNVVQNEKRQGEDNSPYGFTDYVISKNLFPANHPYSWTVIGEMEDLKNASVDDVKNFYNNFYGPNNATLVLAGDFNSDSVKTLINKYFGEIKSHGIVEERSAMLPALDQTKKLYHEDNFANVPELTLSWEAPQSYQKDTYALDFLAQILADGKKAPLYKVLVKEKNLTSATNAFNNPGEIAGMFSINIRANEGISLKEVETAIFEALERFEKEGITDRDIERVKASAEKSFYNGISSVYNKSVKLAFYNTFLNDPGFFQKDIENIKAVTREDIIDVYNRYIKGKPHVVTSFVPKGMADLAAENSGPAGVKEENISEATQVEIAENVNNEVVKTPSSLDRTIEPQAGKDPEAKVPVIWRDQLSNGIKVSGIYNAELPVVDMRIRIDGGVKQDRIDLPGVAGMVASVLPQGTKNKTPEELEEEIELLGSSIRASAGLEEMVISLSALSRNFNKTVDLVKEIILEPRWDSTEFSIQRVRTKNRIIQSEAQPESIASNLFYKLMYGTENIFGYNSIGTRESIDKVTLDDLKAFYAKNFSPSVTMIQVAGNVTHEEVMKALQPLADKWKPADVEINSYPVPDKPEKIQFYFYDLPGSRQSVVKIGTLALSRTDPDFPKVEFVNYRLGGAFTSILNQILREEKGFTYGAFSNFQEMKEIAPFIFTTRVRSDATLPTVKIFLDEVNKYSQGISEDDLQFIKDSMIRSDALRFETNSALAGMLQTIAKYDLPDDYIKREEEIIKGMTVEEHKRITNKYIVPGRMFYVIVGDADTQLKGLEEAGLGSPVVLRKK